MLHVDVVGVANDQVDRLREWMGELEARQDEVQETFAREGTRALQARLLSTSDGYMLVVVADVDDLESGQAAVRSSTLPIDVEHREVMSAVTTGHVDTELLLDMLAF